MTGLKMEDSITTTLMGLVEMDADTASKELSSMERVRLARSCRNAVSHGISGNVRKSTKLKAKDDFINVEALSEQVQIMLSETYISIIQGDKKINHHAIKDISSVAALVDVESQVVYIGHCSIRNKIIAVILSFGSLKNARTLVNNIQQNQKAVQRSEQFQAKDMVGVFRNTLRLSTDGEISVKQLDESQPNNPDLHLTNDDNPSNTAILTDTKIKSSSNEFSIETVSSSSNPELPTKNDVESTIDKTGNNAEKKDASIVTKETNSEELTCANDIEHEYNSNIDLVSQSSETKMEDQISDNKISDNKHNDCLSNDLESTIDKIDNNSIESVENMPAPIPQTFAPIINLQPDSLKKDASSVTKEIKQEKSARSNKSKDKQKNKIDVVPQISTNKSESQILDYNKSDSQNNNYIPNTMEGKFIEEKQATDVNICTNKAQTKKKKKSFLSTLKVSRSNRRKYRHQPHIQFLISQINSTQIISETQENSIEIIGKGLGNNDVPDQHIINDNQDTIVRLRGKTGFISDLSDTDDENLNDTIEDHLYGLLGLRREDQERIYIDITKNESIPGDSPEDKISNQINYLLNDEYMYLETTKLLAVGKESFPEEIQLLLESLENLPDFHDSLYRSLYDGLNDNSKIANAFLERKETFPIYESILVNSFDVERLINTIPDSGKTSFRHLLEPLKIARRRLHFYFTILDSILKLTSSEKSTLQESADMMRGFCQRADTNILINSIRKSPINLHVFKPLLFHSCFTITGGKLDETKIYRVLLFETLMVVTLTNKHFNDYQFDIRIELAHLISDLEDNAFSLEFDRGVFKREKYVFRTSENSIKKMWCNEIAAIQKKFFEKVENTLT